jgi:DNA gyrase subunit B
MLDKRQIKELFNHASVLNQIDRTDYKIVVGTKEINCTTLRQMLYELERISRQGLVIQRHKGLGEMNPDQLWDTTMDPERRILKQVKIEDAIEADEAFADLMGDEVEPRKVFIESVAQDVVNLDI